MTGLRNAWLAVCGLLLLVAAGTAVGVPAEIPSPMPLNAPLYFEANHGQVPGAIQFLARGQRENFAISAAEMDFTLIKMSESPMEMKIDPTPARRITSEARSVSMQFVGGNPNAPVAGLDELPGKVNYLLGNDADQWHTGIATYSRVRVGQLYPGIDLVYYGNHQTFEYDFDVAAGADPSAAAIHFEGTDKLTINAQGELVMKLGSAEICQPKPMLYQVIGGMRKAVSGGYRLRDEKTVEFAIGEYDHGQPLVIDPILNYSSFFGGTAGDTIWSVAVDPNGFIYVAGSTGSSRFITNAPGYSLTNSGGTVDGLEDAFVAKLQNNSSNYDVVYFTYLGGSGNDSGYALAVDADGYAYVAGSTTSTNFPTLNAPTTASAFNGPISYTNINSIYDTRFKGYQSDAFLTKLTPTGTALAYSFYLGGNDQDVAYGVALDPLKNAYVTGFTFSTNFPTVNPFQSKLSGSNDVFVAKISADATIVLYSTYFGGSNYDEGESIAVDAQQFAYVTGFTYSTNLYHVFTTNMLANVYPYTTNIPRTLNNMSNVLTSDYYSDAFVAKFDTVQGNAQSIAYLAIFGGSNNDAGLHIALDTQDNAYVVGMTESFDFPNVGNSNTNFLSGGIATNGLNFDAFLAKIDPNGTNMIFSAPFGGTASDEAVGVTLDPMGDVFMTGFTDSSNFPTNSSNGYLRLNLNSGFDAFVVALAPDLTNILYSVFLGGGQNDYGYDIAADSSGSVYVVGQTLSGDFPLTNAVPPTTYHGGISDAFIAKISLPAPLALTLQEGVTNILLSWPVNQPEYTQYTLQTNGNLALPTNWMVIPQTPLLTNGSNILNLAPTNNALFFRLRKS